MIITRETDYSIRVLRSLQDGKLHNADEIVKEEFIPKQFAYKIIKKLERGHLVKIVHGAHGGCVLACDLNDVSLQDLMTVMGANKKVTSCMDPDFVCPWRSEHGQCKIHCALGTIQNEVDKLLENYSMADIINCQCSSLNFRVPSEA